MSGMDLFKKKKELSKGATSRAGIRRVSRSHGGNAYILGFLLTRLNEFLRKDNQTLTT